MKNLFTTIAIFVLLTACAPQPIPQATQQAALPRAVYTVPGSSFAKIQDCLNAANPGDTCLVSAGTYNEALTLYRSGEPNNPITLSSQGDVIVNSGNAKTLVTSGNVHDWVIDGFRFITTGSGSSTDASINFSYMYWGDGHTGEKGNDRFTLRNCYVEGAVYFYGSENLVENCEINGLGKWGNGLIERSQPSENNVFRNNVIHDYIDRGGWSLQFTVNSLWENNTVYNARLMGIDCDGAGFPVHHCNLIDNTIYHIRGSNGLGVELENCFDCEMRGNHISDTNDALSVINYGPGITGDDVEYRDDPIRGVIENNILESSNTGMICRGAPGGTFRNNVVRNTTQPSGYWGGVGLSNYGGFPCTGWVVTGNQFNDNRFDWFVQAPSGFSLTANSNSYNNFTAKWNEGSISFGDWQGKGYDTTKVPTQTPTVTAVPPTKTCTATATPVPTDMPTRTPTSTPTATPIPLDQCVRVTWTKGLNIRETASMSNLGGVGWLNTGAEFKPVEIVENDDGSTFANIKEDWWVAMRLSDGKVYSIMVACK